MLDIDTRSGYDVNEPYHARLVQVAEAAKAAGITQQPSFYMEVVFPKVSFHFGGPTDLYLSFGSTLDDEEPTTDNRIWWNAWDDTSDTQGDDTYPVPTDAINAAITHLAFRESLSVRADGVVLIGGLCECGHPTVEHQTGEGPWTGFCADGNCKCEAPR